MTWTTQQPTKPGWYWYEDFAMEIGPVIIMWKGSVFEVAGKQGDWFPTNQCQWAGPLQPPTNTNQEEPRR
jgi:hypothetical protein